MYINCKTYYSFRYGTFSTEALVKEAAEKGLQSLALTNINNTYDLWEFVKHCQAQDIKPIAGTEVRNCDDFLYLLLAANNEGVQWINAFLSAHLLEKKDFPTLLNEANTPVPDSVFVVYPLGAKPATALLKNERMGVRHRQLPLLERHSYKGFEHCFVVWHPVTFQNKTYHALHRLMRCIDNNILLSQLTEKQQAVADETFDSPAQLLEKFRLYPRLVTNTYQLMDSCSVQMSFHTDKTKKTYGGSAADDRILLQKLAMDGFKQRYGLKNITALARLEKELKIINDLGFNSYFLINWDIVRYAQGRGFYHVGRGSGANSIVAYCLYITDVDPIELNLFFERFLNPHRKSPPDFDIDFSWTDRDEVMDYVFKRYGKDYVALLGSVSTFKQDAIIQQLGKVMGLPPDEIKALQQSGSATDPIQKIILQYGKLLYGFPNIMSLHPCGMLVSEKPITHYAALFMPPKGFQTTQMDMFSAEDVGLNKFDILSQRGLGHIRDCLSLIKQNKGISVNIHDIAAFKKDERIKSMIREANTIGCFYIESPAMRGLLKKLRCDDYLTLVAASSIIRPGVAESGMMREYIVRYHNRSSIRYPHPMFEEHLSETFGVMVYQEDVIKIAHYFAGLDLGEADILRRAMSGKYRSLNEFNMIRDKFMSNCEKIGHSKELATEVWRQMQSFAGYSFNKAHSASFAVESYQSLYLKTYFPKEFMVAVINNFGGFYSRELYFLELLKWGGNIHPPCVNQSDYYTNIHGNTVYAGFVHVKGLQESLIEKILEDRKQKGRFLHLQELIERIDPGLEQLNTLISVGAFAFTGKTKKRLLWEANFLQKKMVKQADGLQRLFDNSVPEFELPKLADSPIDDLYDQIELLGFPLCNPFSLVDDLPKNYVAARDLKNHVGKKVTVLAYFITRKHVTTKHKDYMFFGTFVDSNLDWIDTVHFPESAARYPFETTGFYTITGKVTEDFGAYSIEVSFMKMAHYKQRIYANL
ncbi:MAG TPA: DNA polymerase III subunit alpha [Niabella sp.]|nr:DNA polymerase III subunit alpha [Niabella sp.]